MQTPFLCHSFFFLQPANVTPLLALKHTISDNLRGVFQNVYRIGSRIQQLIVTHLIPLVLLGTIGCSTTYIHASAPDNPLYRIEQNVKEDWSIEWVDPSTLHLSHFWPIRSIFALGYVASHANLVYDSHASELHIQYYLKQYSPISLFFPVTYDAELPPNPWADYQAAYRRWSTIRTKEIMNEEMDVILMWSRVSVISRRRGKLSETFPPQKPIGLPP